MIDKALQTIGDEVTAFCYSKFGAETGEERLRLSPIVNNENQIAIPQNSLGLSLVNIEEEFAGKEPLTYSKNSDNEPALVNPTIRLNLYIIIAANYANYKEALKAISNVVACFQAKTVFTPQNTPEMDPSINRLSLELQTQGLEQQNQLWSMLGTHYLPSVVYRVRLIAIQENRILEKQALNVEMAQLWHRV